MMTQAHKHGGDLDAMEAVYGIPKEEIIDFSGNINPLGFPSATAAAMASNIGMVSRYPDKGYRKLKESIHAYTGADVSHIVVGNGSTELISTFIHSVDCSHTMIMGPAYSEYEYAVTQAGGQAHYFPLKEEDDFQLNLKALVESINETLGLLILCNPNNPTGTAISIAQMRQILRNCKKYGVAVMVDETYLEFAVHPADYCAIPLVREFDNLFVIRGVSKFFAAPGLRLGYGVSANPTFLANLAKKQDPWSVNILAAFAGEHLFAETEFIAQTRDLILSERIRMLSELHRWQNIKVYPTASNFILVRLLTDKVQANFLLNALMKKKMLIRDCDSFPFLDEHYLRFCIQLPEQNTALLDALKTYIEA